MPNDLAFHDKAASLLKMAIAHSKKEKFQNQLPTNTSTTLRPNQLEPISLNIANEKFNKPNKTLNEIDETLNETDETLLETSDPLIQDRAS
ncbi:hypothetical protein VB715_19495 [Crocosphaera sp. UHCC 0190]|uniref:hypothetical protein n=1 Tax=unclassified Crocosphaera TaxID=2623705 RepID=UPI002B1E9B95|nr:MULTISPECIES: hypothetical protein [unclassified Crocosphaera]MEA5511961.1 hypothetical protein [Crocosphaera sp. UHCC 0190]MEA5536668.1 hypothetical protein [Crocosphaera sp. XPORK-15E]